MVSATDIDAHVDASQDDRDTGGNGERQTYPGPEKHSTRECNVPSSADAPACRCAGYEGAPPAQGTALPENAFGLHVVGSVDNSADVYGNGHLQTHVEDGGCRHFVIGGKSQGAVQLALSGGSFGSCKSTNRKTRKLSGLSAKKKPDKPVRRLWGTGKGKFTTKGKFASATVRGTEWLVADYCKGTLISVRKGVVSVRDLVQKKTKTIQAGHSYLAPAVAPPKKPKKK